MENWGCIFLDEATTNPTKKASSVVSRGKSGDGPSPAITSLVQLIMHEVVHLWLGNLVTLPFWAKEGLAQYFEEIMAAAALQTAPAARRVASARPPAASS